METSPKTKNPAFAALSFATALVSFGFHELTGTWPSELGALGGVLFVFVGAVIVGHCALAGGRVGSGTAGS